jgi:hypothetical protein
VAAAILKPAKNFTAKMILLAKKFYSLLLGCSLFFVPSVNDLNDRVFESKWYNFPVSDLEMRMLKLD